MSATIHTIDLTQAPLRNNASSQGTTLSNTAAAVAPADVTTWESVDDIVERLNQDYAWVEKQARVYRFVFRDFVGIESLRQQFANTSVMVTTGNTEKSWTHAEVWHRSPKRRTHTNVTFVPGGGPVVDNCINFWTGWGVEPVAGDLSPWNQLLNHLFSGNVAMRQWFEQWVAYPIQHPGTKLTTAVVLWSTRQGVGKSMIGETIGNLYGSHSRTVTSKELYGKYNGWMRDCQFIVGEENSRSNHRADADRLKVLITGETQFVEEKFQPAIELNNCMNMLFTSNHSDAFFLEDADRRFFIWEIVADRLPNESYGNFVRWRDEEGGLAALMAHLLTVDLTGFLPKVNAPVTEAKMEMIQQSKSDVERWMTECLDDVASIRALFGREIVHLKDLTEAYHRESGCRVTSMAVSKAFRRRGFHAKRRISAGDGTRPPLFSLANHEHWEVASTEEWATEYARSAPMSL